jgi:hypothetical protein
MPKIPIWVYVGILEGLGEENVGVFYGHLVQFMAVLVYFLLLPIRGTLGRFTFALYICALCAFRTSCSQGEG